MTDETTYREKGRAVVLAALMVLSVVAMSAAFAGSAAATDQDDATADGVQFNTSDSLQDSDVWIGQKITVGDSSVATSDPAYINSSFEIHSGLSGSDSYVTTVRVNGGTGSFDVTSDNFEAGQPYHVVSPDGSGDDTWDGTVFWAGAENLNTEFTKNTVGANGQATLDFESERANQWVNVTADGLDSSDLDDLFTNFNTQGTEIETYSEDDTVALNVTGVSPDSAKSLTVDFGSADVDAGEYEFNFDVTDSDASDSATINVSDQRQDFEFVDVESPAQGDVANITVDVSGADTANVTLGDRANGYDSYANITTNGEEEVVLEFDTHNASTMPWSVHEDSDAEIDDQDVSTDLGAGEAFPAFTWDMSIGDGLEIDSSGDDSYSLDTEHDRGRFAVNERADIGDSTTQIAPAGDDLENDFEDATLTESSAVAANDSVVMTVEDFGAEGLVADIADNASDENLTHAFTQEGIYVEIAEQEAPAIGEATTWNTSTPNGNYLNLTPIGLDEYDGDLVFVLDDVSTDLEADETYDLSFKVTQENAYVDDEDEEVTHESELTIDEREVNWDDISSLPASEDATATGTTTVAPGTELNAEADSPSSQGGFIQVSDAEVTAGSDSAHAFAAEFDLSGESQNVGALFDLIVTDTVEDADGEYASHTAEDVALTAADGESESDISVEGDAPSEVDVDGDATLDVTITNNADEEMTVDYEALIGGEDVSEKGELTIGAGETVEKSYTFDTSSAGDIEWEVTAGDASDSGTLTVAEESSDDSGSDDSGSDDSGSDDSGSDDSGSDDSGSDDGDDDGTPGFGVGVALVALLAAAMLALRRQN